MTPEPNSVLLQSVQSNGIVHASSCYGVLSGPLRRSVGFSGDQAVVFVRKADWPAGWDVNDNIQITLNPAGGVDEKLIAKGYRIKNLVAGQFGVPIGTTDDPVAHQYQVLLETEIRTMRDGRGGLITEGTLNELNEDGLVDTEAADYKTNQELVTLALESLGLEFVPVPDDIDNAIDGSTITAPGPLPWANARSLTEIDALLTRIGWTIVQKLNGKLEAVRLHRAGQPIDITTEVATKAEPYELTGSPSIRGTKILVTSGQTRTTIITSRSLELDSEDPDYDPDRNPLVWVQFDERLNEWLTQADYDILYPDEPGPEDIDAYRSGITAEQLTPQGAKNIGQLFRAVGLTFEDFLTGNSLVNIPSEVDSGDFEPFAGSPGVIEARCAIDTGADQLMNVPKLDDDPLVRIDGVRAVTGDGVFILPPVAEFVRVDGYEMGRKSDTRMLVGDDLTITFAYESNSGEFEQDHFVDGFEAVDSSGTLIIRDLTPEETTDAISDPNTIKINLPFLRRVMLWPEGDAEPTPLNDETLEDIARENAAARVAWGLAESGPIPLRGIVTINPGELDGAIDSITWDQNSHRTMLSINQHEVPRSQSERQRRAIGDSIAAGVGPVYLANSGGSISDARSTMTVDQTLLTPNPGTPESNPQLRGKTRATAGLQAIADSGIASGARLPTLSTMTTILAKITGSTLIDPNRWEYDWEEVRFDPAEATFPSADAVRTSASHGKALNLIEASNTGIGVEGNGVDMANIGTFELKPIAGGPVVELRGPFGESPNTYWRFAATNAIDGTCEES